MATVTEQTNSRVGYSEGVDGPQVAPRVFRVVIDAVTDNPIATLVASSDGVVLGQEYPWLLGSGIVAMRATIAQRQTQYTYIVNVTYGVPGTFPDGGWSRRMIGSLQTEQVEEATTRDGVKVGIGPHWYILDSEWAKPPLAADRIPVVDDLFVATVVDDNGLPKTQTIRRLSGINERRVVPLEVRRPVAQVEYSTTVTSLNKGVEQRALEYRKYTNSGFFDGFAEDTLLCSSITIESAPGQVEGQAVTGIVHNISISIDIDLKGHQPIFQSETFRTAGIESYIRDAAAPGNIVQKEYWPYLDSQGNRRNYNDLLNLFIPFRAIPGR